MNIFHIQKKKFSELIKTKKLSEVMQISDPCHDESYRRLTVENFIAQFSILISDTF